MTSNLASWFIFFFDEEKFMKQKSECTTYNYESKVTCCWHSCTLFSYLTCVCHLWVLIMQCSMLIKSQHIVIYCNKMFDTTTEVQTLPQHLSGVFQLLNKKQQEKNVCTIKHLHIFAFFYPPEQSDAKKKSCKTQALSHWIIMSHHTKSVCRQFFGLSCSHFF